AVSTSDSPFIDTSVTSPTPGTDSDPENATSVWNSSAQPLCSMYFDISTAQRYASLRDDVTTIARACPPSRCATLARKCSTTTATCSAVAFSLVLAKLTISLTTSPLSTRSLRPIASLTLMNMS